MYLFLLRLSLRNKSSPHLYQPDVESQYGQHWQPVAEVDEEEGVDPLEEAVALVVVFNERGGVANLVAKVVVFF